ncbi:MAG TPA: glycosyl hydrolase family 18 protein [Polyangiaceae bacterium]|nr:glycosyl hydrolase family 18 protein [Polyangiaceae bacterium]
MKRVGLSLLLAGIVIATGCMKEGSSPDAQSGNSESSAASSGSSPSSSSAPSGPKHIVAYFPDWTYGRKGCEYKVEDVDASILTHAIFAFARIDADKTKQHFKMGVYDKTDLGPDGQYARFNGLKKKHPHLKTSIAVGGWTFNEKEEDKWIFSAMADNDKARMEYVLDSIAFARLHGFDGIDIDWEYPGHATRGGRPQDTQNFTKLLADFRSAIDEEAKKTGKEPLLLTMAAPAGAGAMSAIEIDKIHTSLDWINLMTYDFAGPWDGRTGVNAPYRETGLGVQASVSVYENFGVPLNKIVLGLATYGRSFANVDKGAVDVPAKGSGPGLRCTQAEGMAAYFEVMELINSGKYKAGWDEKSFTPFAYDAAAKVWITYDDEKSITKKVEWIKEKNLGGAMFWSLDTDDYKKGYPLVSIAKKVLK